MAEDPSIKGKGMALKETFSGINPDLRVLLISDILIRFAEQIPYAFVVIWVVNNLILVHFNLDCLQQLR